MINHILLICSSLAIYEFVKFVNFKNIVKSNLEIYKKIVKLFIYKNVSDIRKQKLIFNYVKKLFLVSIKIIVILISILAFMMTLNLLSSSYINLVLSVLGFIELSVIFIIYHLIRKKFYAEL